MDFFIKRGKFLKITSVATLLAVVPTLALQAQGWVNEENIKATKSVFQKILGKNPFLKIFYGVSLVVILFLLCKIVSFKSGKNYTIKPGGQNTVDENRISNLSNLEENELQKGRKRNLSSKISDIKNEVNIVQKNENKSAHKVDSATGSIAFENKDLGDTAKNLEKNKSKKMKKKIFMQKKTKMKMKNLY